MCSGVYTFLSLQVQVSVLSFKIRLPVLITNAQCAHFQLLSASFNIYYVIVISIIGRFGRNNGNKDGGSAKAQSAMPEVSSQKPKNVYMYVVRTCMQSQC